MQAIRFFVSNICRHSISLLLLSFVLLSSGYSIINPLYEATDELRHYRFVRYVVENHALPVQGEEPCRSQSHHPPLFYWLGALVSAGIQTTQPICNKPPINPFWAYRFEEVGTDNKNQYLPNENEAFPWWGDTLAAHFIRFLNIVIGAVTVWLTWLAGRTFYPERKSVAFGGAVLMAFNPMFLYMSGAINNDVLAAGCGALILWLCLRLARSDSGLNRKWGIIFGVAYGIALLSKFNLAATGLLIGMTVTWVAWQKKQWGGWLQVALLSMGVATIIAGWWFVRNYQLYGDPTGFRMVTALWGVRDPRDSWGLVWLELPSAWQTLWGRFGFGQIPLPAFSYRLLEWVTIFGLIGAIIGWAKKRAGSSYIPLLLLNSLIFFGVLFNYMLVSPAGSMGRFFFPGLPAFSLLIVYGVGQLIELFSERFLPQIRQSTIQQWVSGGFAVGMFIFALWALFGYLHPAYARPPTFAGNAPLPNPINAQFDYFANLRGYELSTTTLTPGEPVDVTLYWEVTGQPPGEYLFFLHLIDIETGAVVAQRDSHPGMGKFPTSQWETGDRFVEQVRVYLPEGAYAPSRLAVSTGLFAQDGYRLAVTDSTGQLIGDGLPLGELAVQSKGGDYPNLQVANFNDVADFMGYEVAKRRLPASKEIVISLYWQSKKQDAGLIQLHLLDLNGHFIAGTEVALPATDEPMTIRLTGVENAGNYQLDLALIDPISKQRLPILAEDGHWINNHLLLTQIRVD